jgi:hypothetical protein
LRREGKLGGFGRDALFRSSALFRIFALFAGLVRSPQHWWRFPPWVLVSGVIGFICYSWGFRLLSRGSYLLSRGSYLLSRGASKRPNEFKPKNLVPAIANQLNLQNVIIFGDSI